MIGGWPFRRAPGCLRHTFTVGDGQAALQGNLSFASVTRCRTERHTDGSRSPPPGRDPSKVHIASQT